ncbi:hypothetical protein Vi05172_g6822 [Venturia inaequalis]|nr:hypothetical protein Vi05172_g6822 [Venturia inaequalis]
MQFPHLALTILSTLPSLAAAATAGKANKLILCRDPPAICTYGVPGSTWMGVSIFSQPPPAPNLKLPHVQ